MIMLIFGIIFFILVVLLIVFWKRTPLPAMLEHRKQVNGARKQIREEAEMEALAGMKEELIEQYRKREIEKLTKPKTNPLKKFGQALANESGNFNVGNKLRANLGIAQQPNTTQPIQQQPQPQQQPQQQYHKKQHHKKHHHPQKQQPRQNTTQPQQQSPQPKLFTNVNREFKLNKKFPSLAQEGFSTKQTDFEKKMKDLLR